MKQADLIVLGGGSAAFAAAIKAAEADRRVVLIESGVIGGTCVNVGCVPSKTLIAAANLRWRALHAPFAGLHLRSEEIDWRRIFDQKQELVDTLREEKYLRVLEAYPQIQWVRGEGFVEAADPVQVRVGAERFQAPRLIVATGARPWIPPIAGLADTPFWTSTEALAAERRPERLLVIGASAVGLELGQLYHRLGSEVTVLEAVDRILPTEDPEVSAALTESLTDEGMAIFAAVQLERVRYDGQRFTVEGRRHGSPFSWSGDQVLVATGRRPHATGFGLEHVGVQLTPRGGIAVDDRMQTSVPTIYAAGDVTGEAQFVYVAAEAGGIAATNALELGERRLDLRALPRVTFTDPQVASVGYTDEAAEAAGIPCTCSALPLAYVPRALANRDTRGFIKLVVEQGTEQVIGMQAVAPEAGEIIQVGVFAVRFGMTLEDLTTTLFPYLTMVEGVKLAALTFHKDVSKLSCCAGS
ncbi:MAG: mercury(II) reductase [Firmicutes bacterium]|nr:mercury(II) reductase [Alicyclobacillaceae bacterium]MCL6498324.1 mercury(II) reductase [Bacillota bacterium]